METPNNATTSTNNKIPEESVICHENIKGYVEPRFECSICLSWLQDPVLTSCGHKFCSECIRNWLEKGGVCPVDNQPLKSENLFRDLYTSREISEKRITCRYQQFGCQVELSPVDVETHINQCTYRRNLPESQVQNTNNAMSAESKLWDPTPKNGTQITDREPSPDWQQLVKNLYEKIIALQQENQALSIMVSNQKNKLETMCLRNCNGICIWRLDSFQEKLTAMLNDPLTKMFYSPDFYTNPNGYKICARLNIFSQNSDYLSLVLHFMKSENDDALDWPFDGKMYFILVHPQDSKKNICETAKSVPNVEAFRKPTCDRNKRSYGFQEFVRVCDVFNFLQNNSLIFRIEVCAKLHNDSDKDSNTATV
ncbi:TNF receptor-associated factor 6-A isoform X2 [Camponotus floridanus]|uniref:TNF receptor-associated factor 6-A isoform X2 n=1 Tax=Camponotus floridanus TaxID=104421 RepID=UPI00059CB150|nr:TNF receptor-associated factor 6-A isoform X2 [Camponotus floridanus]